MTRPDKRAARFGFRWVLRGTPFAVREGRLVIVSKAKR